MQDDDAVIEQQFDEETKVGTPSDDPKDILREAREMIPVGRAGAAPGNFADMVQFAQDMAKANAAIPQHLKRNVGDCLAVLDISTRVGLSPFMVANKTYVQAGRLCFESQLYHAFAQASGLLKGDLTVEYEGEGEDMRCIVTGFLKNDPRPRVHVSEKLKDAHPGHTTKTVDGKEKTFCKGSPLWDKKPKVQLFYDTSRDWVRIYCPRATLGIFTPDEIDEYGPEFARDVTPGSGLAARLAAAPPSDQGHKDGHAETEIKSLRAENGTIAEDVVAKTADPGEALERAKVKVKKKSLRAPPGKNPAVKDAGKAGRTDDSPTGRGASPTHQATKVSYPSTVSEYVAYARRWLKAENDKVEIGQRWSRERKMRNEIGLTAEDRAPLEELMRKLVG